MSSAIVKKNLEQQIGVISQRLVLISDQAEGSQSPPKELLAETLEELSVTLEALQETQADLTQRNAELVATFQLVEAEQRRYRELFEFAPDGYLVTDQQGKILAANRAASAMLNLSQTHLVNKVMTVFVVEADRRAFRRDLLLLQELERLSERFVRLQPRENPAFEAAMTVTSIYSTAGEVTGWRWLIRDITERRQLEEARVRAQLGEIINQSLEQEILQRRQLETQLHQQTAALKQADRLKDEFLAIVSHELRSPLTAILGWAQLLNQQQLDPTMTARALAAIERNAVAQEELIANLLDVSQILRGGLVLTLGPVELGASIRDAVETMQPAAKAKQIEIQLTIQPVASFISGDAARIQQILLNLITNAIKFTPDEGKVWVSLERTATDVLVKVSDSGQGIKAEFLPHLFDSFWQADPSATRQEGGIGLGLAIVRRLVKLHRGRVEADSPGLNQGASFTVTLPLIAVQTSEEEAILFRAEGSIASLRPSLIADDGAESGVSFNARLAQVNILLVEDQVDARELLAFLLEQAGASVTAVSSAAEALAALGQSLPDLLVSDINLPETDGYALIQQVRAIEAAANLPAIALTALTSPAAQSRIFASGFQLYLPKPVNPAQLIAAIANQLHSGQNP